MYSNDLRLDNSSKNKELKVHKWFKLHKDNSSFPDFCLPCYAVKQIHVLIKAIKILQEL